MPITEMNIRTIGLNDAFAREFQRFPNPGRVVEDGFLLPFEREAARDKQGDRPEVQRRDDDPNREKGHGEPEYKPELVCRTYAGDGGARPLAPGIVFWESPDIWVVAPDGSAIPVAGQVNQVKVHVWNLGLAPCYGVQVELFWCNPSVGVNLASATQIATTQTIALNAGEHRVLSFDWTPSFVNNGHECLVAQVYDPVADTMVAPFNPVQDRHVAQHNVNVIRVQAGMQIHLQFFAANLSQMHAHSAIHVEQVHGEPLQAFAQAVGHTHLLTASNALAMIANVDRREAIPTLDLAQHPAAAVFRESLEPMPQRVVRSLLGSALVALPAEADNRQVQAELYQQQAITRELSTGSVADKNRLSHETDIRPGQELAVTLAIALPENAVKGISYVYRVIEQSEGRITGGITYLVEVG